MSDNILIVEDEVLEAEYLENLLRETDCSFSRASSLKEAKKNRMLLICHSEDKTLSGKGVVNLGIMSTRLGLRGIPKQAEYTAIDRDIRLAERASCPVHIAHVSCRESVEIIAKAKQRGIRVSAETAPHYFSFTQERTEGYDTNAKMNPPLRSREDMEAIRQGLTQGTIDAIASDHAPHTANEKGVEFEYAEFGVIGLETLLAASITGLVETGILDWPHLVRKLSVNPAEILGLQKGNLSCGRDADIIVVDPDRVWRVEADGFLSRSSNSAFLGCQLKGVVEYTICAGRVIQRR